MTKKLQSTLDDLEKKFLKLEKSKETAIKMMEQGIISEKTSQDWHNLIYNLRLVIVRAKRNPRFQKDGTEIDLIKNELHKITKLTEDLVKKEKERK